MGKPGSIYREWWQAYGAWSALLRSRYLQASVVIAALTFPNLAAGEWSKLALEILPSMLGFSLGGYAILMSFGSESFQQLLARAGSKDPKSGDAKPSVYLQISATFVHFIVLQVFGILMALFVPNIFPSAPVAIVTSLSFMGWLITLYSILSAMSLTFWIFRMTRWFAINEVTKAEQESAAKGGDRSPPKRSKSTPTAPEGEA